MAQWRAAPDEHTLKEILLRDDRFVTLLVAAGSKSEALIGRAIREIDIPEGCLVAIIRRKGATLVPRGETVLREGDWLTVIGSTTGVRRLRELYGPDGLAGET